MNPRIIHNKPYRDLIANSKQLVVMIFLWFTISFFTIGNAYCQESKIEGNQGTVSSSHFESATLGQRALVILILGIIGLEPTDAWLIICVVELT